MNHPLSSILNSHGDVIGVALLVALFVGFALERLPPVVLAVAGGVTMMALGFVETKELL